MCGVRRDGPPSRAAPVPPGAGWLPQRLLGVAAARALRSRPRHRPGERAQGAAPAGEPWALGSLANPGGAGGPRGGVRPPSGGPPPAPGERGGMPSAASRPVPTPRRDPPAAPAPDLVQRAGSAPAPHQLWRADITDVPTKHEDVLYRAVILAGWSRRVVGWSSMQAPLRTDWVSAALELARWRRRPAEGLLPHADHGGQYTALRFGPRCATAGLRSSRGGCRGLLGQRPEGELLRPAAR